MLLHYKLVIQIQQNMNCHCIHLQVEKLTTELYEHPAGVSTKTNLCFPVISGNISLSGFK